MIVAEAAKIDNQLLVQFTYPGERKKPVYKYVINQREARMVTYQQYRKYIFERLTSWLKQRSYGLLASDPYRAKMAHQLQVLLGVFEKATLRNICKYVADNEEHFKYLAPSQKSKRFYKHYTTRILPVLNFCNEIGGPDA